MWNCSTCCESHDDAFAVCWQCGTDCEGAVDPHFRSECKTEETVAEPNARTLREWWQFSLWHLVSLLTGAALACGVGRGIDDTVATAFVGIAAANILGLIVGWIVNWRPAQKIDVEAEPLCLHCLQTVSRRAHYCHGCGQVVGQMTPYLPYEGIWFNAGMYGKLWERLWYRDVDSLGRKLFFVSLIASVAPILLLALPSVWMRPDKR